MKDFCQYADPFYGNGQVTRFAEDGTASKWFFIKAQCGNTTPHAVLPFGKMSVGAYSGGYPTGYGTHFPNSCGGIKKLWDRMKIIGFSHLHQSGTGAIDYYYNYAVVSPFYGELGSAFELKDFENETAVPGKYSVCLPGVKAELTVTHEVALHRYTFERDGGRAAVDFSNDGLSKVFEEKYHSHPEDVTVSVKDGRVFFSGILSGIRLYFCIAPSAPELKISLFENGEALEASSVKIASPDKAFGAVFDFDGRELLLNVAYSTLSPEAASVQIDAAADGFDVTAEKAYKRWNDVLSVIDIDTDDDTLCRRFYSCLYHSFIKPAILPGETLHGVTQGAVTDYATFWDQYKTLFPLIFTLFGEEGKAIAEGMAKLSEGLGKMPASAGLTTMFPCDGQALSLGILSLCDAFYAGLVPKETVVDCMKRELEREEYKAFAETGLLERYTHILDAAEACRACVPLTDDAELKSRLLALAENWKNAYGDDGLMSEKSNYYEGDRYTYSFRLHGDMEKRIALAGGRERFVTLLDTFFGFNGESLKQITDETMAWKLIADTHYHRFEGFNNECDMETPFAYIFAGRHDRLSEITRAAVYDVFSDGKSGIPGNNDSGGLSSCFVWLVLGLFPWVGQGKMLVGCPLIKSAEIKLSSGNTLKITVSGEYDGTNDVTEVRFNGKAVDGFVLNTAEIMNGGELEITINK